MTGNSRIASPALICGLLFVAALASFPAGAYAPREALYEISAKDLAEDDSQIAFPTWWRFHPDDNPDFAKTNFDDSEWIQADTRLFADDRPASWNGVGWFRIRFLVSPGLREVPLGLNLRQFGAAEIYLDGLLLHAVGTIEDDGSVQPRIQRRPHLFDFNDRSEHVLAVRFANPHADAFEEVGKLAGFAMTLGFAGNEVDAYSENLRSLSTYKAFFTALFAAFALLHFLFWVFYREADENLYFSQLSGVVAVLAFLFFESHFTQDPTFFLEFERSSNLAALLLAITALRFVYCIYDRPPRHFYWVLGAAIVLAVPGWFLPDAARGGILLVAILSAVEMVRTVVVANVRRQAGARIVGAGILILAAGLAFGLLANLGLVPPSIVTLFLIPAGSVLALVFTMSIYLSRRFAQTNHELRAQLVQVRELSERQLEQERKATEDELERRLLAAENQRQAQELEEARKLQLSLLPESLPDLPELEIAAGMFTATEVGGDYYDFEVADDGTLTIAIGDATGHGMKAGTLVSATKSLFKAFGEEAALPETLGRFGKALKRMKLRQLSMALTLARFKAGRLSLAAAGMPPALVHRADSGSVESIGDGGAPLGTLAEFPYRESSLDLASGDTVLLMSDGFPERLNADDEMLGYDEVRDAFSKVATTPPQTIIDSLVHHSETWADGTPAVDDTTFVVLKMR